jgi:hypothetical protein
VWRIYCKFEVKFLFTEYNFVISILSFQTINFLRFMILHQNLHTIHVLPSSEFKTCDPIDSVKHYIRLFPVHTDSFEHHVHPVFFCYFHCFFIRFRDIKIYSFTRDRSFKGLKYFLCCVPIIRKKRPYLVSLTAFPYNTISFQFFGFKFCKGIRIRLLYSFFKKN